MIHQRKDSSNHVSCRPGGVVRIVIWVFLGMLAAAAFALVFAILVKVLWNWLMPGLFGLPVIGFWQAFGVLLLAKILFGGHGHAKHHGDHGDKSGHIHNWFHRQADPPGSPQRDAWLGPRSRDDFNAFWEVEGRDAFHEFIARRRRESGAAQEEES